MVSLPGGRQRVEGDAKNTSIYLLFARPATISLTAISSTAEQLSVNSKTSHQVESYVNPRQKTYVTISPALVTYFFSVRLSNKLDVPVAVNCLYGGKTKTIQLQANEQKKLFQMALASMKKPLAMECSSAKVPSLGITPTINGLSKVPVEAQKSNTSAVELVIDFPQEYQFIHLQVYNWVSSAVQLKWKDLKMNGQRIIPVGAQNMLVRLILKGKNEVILSASSNIGGVLVNKNQKISLTSTEDREKRVRVDITRELTNYYYSATIRSSLYTPVDLNCTYGNLSKTIRIEPNASRIIQYQVKRTKRPDTMQCVPILLDEYMEFTPEV